MHRGYVKFWRKSVDNVHFKDPHFFALWTWLLLLAAHKEKPALFGGKKVVLKPGQLVTTRNELASISGCNPSKIARVLQTLKIEQQIEQRTSTVNRLITIVNWNQYQQSEQQSEQRANNERTTPYIYLKNEKNEKKKEISSLCSDDQFAKLYNRYPRKLGKKAAIRHYYASVKTERDRENIEKALDNYIEHCKKLSSQQYIQHASTWFNNWQDWVNETQEQAQCNNRRLL